MAVVAAATRRRALAPSYAHVHETFGALPTMATAGLTCTWSSMTNGNAIRQAKGLKAFGARRLGEIST